MGRYYQIFETYELETPLDELMLPSPWVVEDSVRIPLEHWELLGQLAQQRKYFPYDVWEMVSQNEEHDLTYDMLEAFLDTLCKLESELRTDTMGMLQRSQSFPEPLPGSEHSRMIAAVRTAIEAGEGEFVSYREEVFDSDDEDASEEA